MRIEDELPVDGTETGDTNGEQPAVTEPEAEEASPEVGEEDSEADAGEEGSEEESEGTEE